MDAAFQRLPVFFMKPCHGYRRRRKGTVTRLYRPSGKPSAKQNVKVIKDVVWQTSKPLLWYVHLGNTINFYETRSPVPDIDNTGCNITAMHLFSIKYNEKGKYGHIKKEPGLFPHRLVEG